MKTLKKLIKTAYFIPAGTSLTRQLLNFQDNRRRSGLVVDEYGSIQGLVTLEDILEEIVGQFTTDSPTRNLSIHAVDSNKYLIDGNTHIREINRALNWSLPANGPKTLNGLILEHTGTHGDYSTERHQLDDRGICYRNNKDHKQRCADGKNNQDQVGKK
jgi:Mg2+/Co2+ transporter CorB